MNTEQGPERVKIVQHLDRWQSREQGVQAVANQGGNHQPSDAVTG